MMELIPIWRVHRSGYKMFFCFSKMGRYRNLSDFLYEQALLKLKYADALENLIISSSVHHLCCHKTSVRLLPSLEYYRALDIDGWMGDVEILEHSMAHQIMAVHKYRQILPLLHNCLSIHAVLETQYHEMLEALKIFNFIDEALSEDF